VSALLAPVSPSGAQRSALAPARPLDVVAVHDLHASFVWCSLQRLGVRAHDLDDVFQEVFLVVHKRLHTFDGSSQLTTWLFSVCLRVAAAHRRRAWFRRETPTDRFPDVEEASSRRPDELLAARQARALVERALDRMDLEKRAVFVMFEIDELPSEEIAVTLGVPIGTVWSRLHTARKQFHAALTRLQAKVARGGAP
jgi:RNA polymerase sigma-70 factor (ECF subfamily)